jgi:hypothetical protein
MGRYEMMRRVPCAYAMKITYSENTGMKSPVFTAVGMQTKKGMNGSKEPRPNLIKSGIEITAGDTPKARGHIGVSPRGWDD